MMGFEATTAIVRWAESFDGKEWELPFSTLSILLPLLSTPNHTAILKVTEQRFGFLIFKKKQSMLEATVQSIKGLTEFLTKENVNF